jgi:AcrR family transcriptional regulator
VTAGEVGLRERKRMRTMAAIQQAAFRLFAEQGYDATTVEQIAAAAEVSPATFFRYFPAKEDLVGTDEFDPMLLDTLAARPAEEDVVTAMRATIRELVPLLEQGGESVLARFRLVAGSNRLGAQLWMGYRRNVDSLAETLARRLGRDPDDLEVRVAASAVVGALLEALFAWVASDGRDDLGDVLDRTLDSLAALGSLTNPNF